MSRARFNSFIISSRKFIAVINVVGSLVLLGKVLSFPLQEWSELYGPLQEENKSYANTIC